VLTIGFWIDLGNITPLALLLGSALIALATVLLVLLLGLPLRLSERAGQWWTKNGEVSVVGVLAGVGIVILSVAFGNRGTPFFPNTGLQLAGYVVLPFFIVHFQWPRRWQVGQPHVLPPK
jgi:hypothetical protein